MARADWKDEAPKVPFPIPRKNESYLEKSKQNLRDSYKLKLYTKTPVKIILKIKLKMEKNVY